MKVSDRQIDRQFLNKLGTHADVIYQMYGR